MSRSSEYFELVLVGFVAAFAYLFQPIFEHLFAGALMAWLEKSMRPSEAEVIAHLSEIALPIIGLVLLIWALCRFLRREMERRFINEDARLELAKLRTEGVDLRNRCMLLTTSLSEWVAECQSWTQQVIETIKKI